MQNPQGILENRYKVVPRVIIFLFKDNSVLLQRGAPDKKLWPNVYNGIGGHIERGEDLLSAAYRELDEETGLRSIKLILCGTVIIDANPDTGVALFIFAGKYQKGNIRASVEGKLDWIELQKVETLPIMPDLPCLLEHTEKAFKDRHMFFGRSWYDNKGELRIDITDLLDFFEKDKQC